MSEPTRCEHRRLVKAKPCHWCADCGEIVAVGYSSIKDCDHRSWRMGMLPPYPDRFPCPQCGEWVEVVTVASSNIQ